MCWYYRPVWCSPGPILTQLLDPLISSQLVISPPEEQMHWTLNKMAAILFLPECVSSSDVADGIFQLIWSSPSCLLIPWLLKSAGHQQAWYKQVGMCKCIDAQLWIWSSSVEQQCRRKTSMVHQTFVWWALYILYEFEKFPIRHLGLAIGNVQCVRCFSSTLEQNPRYDAKCEYNLIILKTIQHVKS